MLLTIFKIGSHEQTYFDCHCSAAGLRFRAGGRADGALPGAGLYRTTLGDFEITVLNDGTLDLPVDKLLKQPPAKTIAALDKSFQKSPLQTSVNGFLINTGSKLVLIDTGAASLFGPTLGQLVGNLKAAGYKPEQVDEIYISHMHGDHVGGWRPTNSACSRTPWCGPGSWMRITI
jgi:hypothetical protein